MKAAVKVQTQHWENYIGVAAAPTGLIKAGPPAFGAFSEKDTLYVYACVYASVDNASFFLYHLPNFRGLQQQ